MQNFQTAVLKLTSHLAALEPAPVPLDEAADTVAELHAAATACREMIATSRDIMKQFRDAASAVLGPGAVAVTNVSTMPMPPPLNSSE